MELVANPRSEQSIFPEFPVYDRFDAHKKRLFLDQFAKTPNIHGVATALGHSRQVIFWHLERDPEFKKAFNAIREGLTDQLESKVHEYAQRPHGFLDRIAWLRAYRAERWNPKPEMSVKHSVEITHSLAGAVGNYVDTTATPLIAGTTETQLTDGANEI